MPNTIPEISKDIFGGILDSDSSGFYPGLELLNYIYGSPAPTPLPQGDGLKFSKFSQDFARRLVWDYENFEAMGYGHDVFIGKNAGLTIQKIMECLKVTIPNRKTRNWEAAHFFPYTKSLVHWDARSRGKKIIIERRYFRGAGALAYKILRTDPDDDRRNKTSEALASLMQLENQTPLERLSKVLANLAQAKEEKQKPDDIENETRVTNDDLEELYRKSISSILSHTRLSSVIKIRSIITWTGFWFVLLQASRAATYLGKNEPVLIIDCGFPKTKIRRESNRCLDRMLDNISVAANLCAQQQLKSKDLNKLRGFFTSTAATIGLLNAFKGKRHFKINDEKSDLIEALVLASTKPEEEIPVENFVHNILFKKFNLVIGRGAAEDSGLLSNINGSTFEDNENYLYSHIKEAGFLRDYSDSTKMVSAEVLM
tara:strand:- start:4800 stop:6083 length:1284 start_codon:yes stop_codon:yes gene_type:complete